MRPCTEAVIAAGGGLRDVAIGYAADGTGWPLGA